MSVLAPVTGLRHRPALILLTLLAIPTVLVISVQLAIFASAELAAAALTITVSLITVAVVLVFIRVTAPDAVPLRVAVAALAWGALAAPVIAVVAMAPWSSALAGSFGDPTSPWSDSVIAGPVEEPAKLLGLALLAVAWPRSVRGARAGQVAGMLIGLGFETVEHILYAQFVAVVAPPGASIEAVSWTLLARIVGSGLFLHVGFTGLAGMVAGWALGRPSVHRWLVAAATLVGVAALHALANQGPIVPPSLPWAAEEIGPVAVASLVRSLPFLLLVVLLVRQRVYATQRPTELARSAQ